MTDVVFVVGVIALGYAVPSAWAWWCGRRVSEPEAESESEPEKSEPEPEPGSLDDVRARISARLQEGYERLSKTKHRAVMHGRFRLSERKYSLGWVRVHYSGWSSEWGIAIKKTYKGAGEDEPKWLRINDGELFDVPGLDVEALRAMVVAALPELIDHVEQSERDRAEHLRVLAGGRL